MKIPTRVEEDFIAWQPDSKGRFSVKSTYKLFMKAADQQQGQRGNSITGLNCFEWRKIWASQYPNKVKHFIWRLAHISLPLHELTPDALCVFALMNMEAIFS